MTRPLDHITVLQQINFAERVHQDQQTHPELTMLKAEAAGRRMKAEARQRPNPTTSTRRTGVRLHGENYRAVRHSSGARVDLKA